MSLSSFGDNGRNGGKKQLSPNMILLLVGLIATVFVAFHISAPMLIHKRAEKRRKQLEERPCRPVESLTGVAREGDAIR